ncbi:2-C-methyl-D-erythritol 2,4-cyclodiphosphate synthase [Eubacteriales bacterium mix99]|jgi:2-C-methyl-D-erythritol 2,4-cyclodiphosphate synthase
MRVGIGYDVHRFAEGRPLILGGVNIPWERGLLGHSDADALVHAIMDAMLGAAALGDIGQHFPDSQEAYRDISSLLLLKRVSGLLREKGFGIVNLDAVIIAQRPRMAPYLPKMKENISSVLHVDPACINIKATTTEWLGFSGRQEGIAAQAVALIDGM